MNRKIKSDCYHRYLKKTMTIFSVQLRLQHRLPLQTEPELPSPVLWAFLKSLGVENKLVNLVKIYTFSQSAVRIGSDITEWFQTKVGTQQGDPLSLLLFIKYLERVMDTITQEAQGVNIGGTMVSNLRFADKIDLLNEDYDSLCSQMEKVIKAAEKTGLIVNTNKIKTMVFEAKHGRRGVSSRNSNRKRRQIRILEKLTHMGQ